MSEARNFYDDLPRVESFADLTSPANYTPLPDDWVIGTADIKGSTRLIAEGQYKTVNMLGASVISAHVNALGGGPFPFVFGGDGASFAVAPDDAETSAQVLATLKRWAEEEFEIVLRVGQVSVSDIRAAGHDVSVARYQVSKGLDYAMFSGGGVSWAEAQMKQGENTIPSAPSGSIPDLEGLSCRWNNARSRNGSILSLVVEPVSDKTQAEFDIAAGEIVKLAAELDRSGHPLPPEGPGLQFPPPGLTLEAHLSRGRASMFRRRLELILENMIAWVFFKAGIKTGDFEPVHYKAMVSTNTDFRKFDDGLKMTLDCNAKTREKICVLLEKAKADGVLLYGMVEQDEAMITCFVPSIHQDDHIHLVDGAAGGYTKAAELMKALPA